MGQTIDTLARQAGLTPEQVTRLLRALRRPPTRTVDAGRDTMLQCNPRDEGVEEKIFTAMVDEALG